MTDPLRLGPWVRRFLLEHLINERNLSRGTQRSYRDTLTLLIPFVARQAASASMIWMSSMSLPTRLGGSWHILRTAGRTLLRPETNAWLLSTLWPVLWACTAPNTSLGAEKSAPYPSRNALRRQSHI
jgi:hypothetical protein